MKVILFLLLTVSLVLPLSVYAESTPKDDIVSTMENKVRDLMAEKSKLPESKKNTYDYWCLSDYLLVLVEARIDASPEKLDREKLKVLGEKLYEKYYDDENFLHPDTPSRLWDYGVSSSGLSLLMDGEDTLKMVKAQEILDNYNDVVFDRVIIMESPVEPCIGAIENMIDISIVQDPANINSLFMNMRGDIVSVKKSSVNTLLERGYLMIPVMIDNL